MEPFIRLVISISCVLCTACLEKPKAVNNNTIIPNVKEQKELTILLNDIYDNEWIEFNL